MALEASFRAVGCRVVVRIERYEFPEPRTDYDANWLVGEVELVTDLPGRYRAVQPLTLRADELVDFRDELQDVVDDDSHDACLSADEMGADIIVSLEPGEDTGTLWSLVHNAHGSMMAIEDVALDRSAARLGLLEVNELVRAFPERANLADID